MFSAMDRHRTSDVIDRKTVHRDAEMPARSRFVLLFHELPPNSVRPSHWDLMLEKDGVLQTWAIAQNPLNKGVYDAVQLADHRIDYLSFQGPISGDRGHVSRTDFGDIVRWQALPEPGQGFVIVLKSNHSNTSLRLTFRHRTERQWSIEANFIAAD